MTLKIARPIAAALGQQLRIAARSTRTDKGRVPLIPDVEWDEAALKALGAILGADVDFEDRRMLSGTSTKDRPWAQPMIKARG